MAKKTIGAPAAKKDEAKKQDEEKSAKRTDFKAPPEGGWTQAIPEGFDFEQHFALKKPAFEKEHLYAEHKAAECDYRIKQLEERKKSFNERAEHLKKFGDSKMASKMKRAERVAKQLAELKKTLSEAGVDLSSLNLG